MMDYHIYTNLLPEKIEEDFVLKSKLISDRAIQSEGLIYDDFYEAITKRGNPYTSCLFNSKNRKEQFFRDKTCFTMMNIVPIIFEKETNINQLLDILRATGLNSWISYKLPSGRIVVIFKLREPITHVGVALIIKKALTEILEAPLKNKYLETVYYGSECDDEDIFRRRDDLFLDVSQLMRLYIEKLNGNGNRMRAFRTFCQETYLKMGPELPRIEFNSNEVEEVDSYPYLYNDGNKKTTFVFGVPEEVVRYSENYDLQLSEKQKPKINTVSEYDFSKLHSGCKLYREALTGEHWLTFNELQLMLSNLMHIEGGMKKMNEILSSRDNCEHDLDKDGIHYANGPYDICGRKQQFRENGTMHKYFLNAEYNAFSCEGRCPHYNDCKMQSIKNAGLSGVLDVIKLNDEHVDLADQSFQKTVEAMDWFISDKSIRKFALRVDTSIGKTQAMIIKAVKLAADGNRIIVAVPSHILKEDVVKRFEKELAKYQNLHKGPKLYQFVDIVKFMDPEEQKLILYFYRTQNHNKAAGRIRRWVEDKYKELPVGPIAHEGERERAIRLQYDAITNSDNNNTHSCVILMTHERYIGASDMKADYVFIDEDIFSKLVVVSEFKKADLERLEKLLKYAGDSINGNHIRSVIDEINAANDGTCEKLKAREYNTDKILEFVSKHQYDFDSDVFTFLSQRGAIYAKSIYPGHAGTIYYGYKRKLPDNKTFMMSATADKILYEKLFKESNFIFKDLPSTKLVGKIIQYHKRSYTKSKIQRQNAKARKREQSENAFLDEFVEICNGQNVITSKFIKAVYDKAVAKGDIAEGTVNIIGTFMALDGVDKYKGQNITVFGTLHQPSIAYLLAAELLQMNTGMNDFSKSEPYQIKRNGFMFSYNCYSSDPDLQELQLHMIEAAIIQAIGRARLARYDCVVTVYSDIPIRQAKIEDNRFEA